MSVEVCVRRGNAAEENFDGAYIGVKGALQDGSRVLWRVSEASPFLVMYGLEHGLTSASIDCVVL